MRTNKLSKKLGNLPIFGVIRSYFYVVRFKWVKLEWLDDNKNSVKYVECEFKDAEWQLRVEEPRFKWMRWLGFRNCV